MATADSTRAEGGRRFTEAPRQKAPLVSTITVVFNDREDLGHILESIDRVRTPEVEVIVIDGGSKDGTIELLRQSEDKVDYWLSEPDRGIYDAMNKGLAAATGEYVLHLNAGDRLLAIPFDRLRKSLEDEVDVVCFRVTSPPRSSVFRPRTGFLMRLENTWHHQGTFYRRVKHPGYDASYRVFGDYDANQKMQKAGRRVRIYDECVANQETQGLSENEASMAEYYHLIRTNFGWHWLVLARLWKRLMPLRRIVNRFRTSLESRRSS